jgi:hypothetical protein
VTIIKELKATKEVVKETKNVIAETKAAVVENAAQGAQAGDIRDVKLDRIELLVDGRYGKVLQELADVKRMLAAESGKDIDKVKANDAQDLADEQQKRVEISNKDRV